MALTLYILYNADASIMGKLNYGYRKLTAAKDQPACAACDITHGGLRLDETKEWKAIKQTIANEGVEIKQLHRDELSDELKKFVTDNELKYPVVLSGDGSSDLRVAIGSEELGACKGDAEAFIGKLRERGVLKRVNESFL
ncbi:MAG: hypothetical protein LQ338_004460 [Usnochroma carphineum]|nr:MAG: hypothetical protein LQ338_004460 [Usnochroma carphineum]